MSRLILVAALLSQAASLEAQSVANRIRQAKDGEVRLAFAAREGICGDGRSFIRDRSRGDGNFITMDNWDGSKGWRSRPCEEGPVRVAIRVRESEIRSVKTYVGGDWPSSSGSNTDLGVVAANAAASALLEVARTSKGGGGDDLIFPATIADSATVWPRLLELARDRSVIRETRKQAVFWVSQTAGDKAAAGLDDLVADDDEDREIRDQAVFALSQLPRDTGIPVLLRVARDNKDPQIRRKAMFWLGQSDDPRALDLFEEILSKPQ